jgi:hypothetical protein
MNDIPFNEDISEYRLNRKENRMDILCSDKFGDAKIDNKIEFQSIIFAKNILNSKKIKS